MFIPIGTLERRQGKVLVFTNKQNNNKQAFKDFEGHMSIVFFNNARVKYT